jgi:hypothetical protein
MLSLADAIEQPLPAPGHSDAVNALAAPLWRIATPP